jgi:hypothetical protein
MKNITLAMVTVLAAVAMLSAVLAVPMQQAIAEDGDGKDGKDGKDGNDGIFSGGDENSVDSEIRQENDCGDNEDAAVTDCLNTAAVTNAPVLTLPDTLPDMMLP